MSLTIGDKLMELGALLNKRDEHMHKAFVASRGGDEPLSRREVRLGNLDKARRRELKAELRCAGALQIS